MSKKKVRNPLIKRIPKELIGDWKKYLVVFLFLVLTIGFVSGMYVANESMLKSAADGVKEYKQEDGHFELKKQADDALLSAIETGEKADVKQYYLDEAKKKLDKKFPKKFKSTFDEKFKSKFDAQFSAQVKQTLVAQGMDEQTVAAMLPAAVKQAKTDGTMLTIRHTVVRTQTLTTKPMMRHGRKHRIRSKTNMPMPKKSTN